MAKKKPKPVSSGKCPNCGGPLARVPKLKICAACGAKFLDDGTQVPI